MSQSIPQWFIDMFERDVHHAYQRQGARLENTVRHGGTGEGMRVKFPKLGLSSVSQKARHAQVAIQDRDEAFVWCNIEDWYVGDMVDSLDELKTNIAARQEYAMSQSYALGRKSDGLIVDAINNATNATSGVGKIDLAKVNEAYTFLGNNSVPADNNRFFAVSPKGWTDLMAIEPFANADYIAENEMPFRGAAGVAKRWFSFNVFTQEGSATEDGTLPKTGNERTSMIWHRRAIGYHRQKGPGIQVDWENLNQAWSIVGCIACGAVLIDDNGVYKVLHDETAT